MIPTFRPWTHTSDDSYIYQLSLVVATATVSLYLDTEWYRIPRIRTNKKKGAKKQTEFISVGAGG